MSRHPLNDRISILRTTSGEPDELGNPTDTTSARGPFRGNTFYRASQLKSAGLANDRTPILSDEWVLLIELPRGEDLLKRDRISSRDGDFEIVERPSTLRLFTPVGRTVRAVLRQIEAGR